MGKEEKASRLRKGEMPAAWHALQTVSETFSLFREGMKLLGQAKAKADYKKPLEMLAEVVDSYRFDALKAYVCKQDQCRPFYNDDNIFLWAAKEIVTHADKFAGLDQQVHSLKLASIAAHEYHDADLMWNSLEKVIGVLDQKNQRTNEALPVSKRIGERLFVASALRLRVRDLAFQGDKRWQEWSKFAHDVADTVMQEAKGLPLDEQALTYLAAGLCMKPDSKKQQETFKKFFDVVETAADGHKVLCDDKREMLYNYAVQQAQLYFVTSLSDWCGERLRQIVLAAQAEAVKRQANVLIFARPSKGTGATP